MATSYIVATAHTVDNFSKGIDRSGPYINVQYYINSYADVDRFINALVGSGTVTGSATAANIVRTTPHQHPLSPNLFAISAQLVQGLGNPILGTDGYPNFDGGALIACEYRPLSWDAINADTNNSIDPTTNILYCTQEIDFATETFTIDQNTFKYSGGPAGTVNNPTGVPAKFTIPVTELILTFHQLPYMPMTAARALRGRVNTLTFLGAQPGCVLFRGCKTTREWNTDGTVVQRAQFMFSERDPLHKWNWLPSRTSLTWYPVTEDGNAGGTTMFPTGDLNPLLQS